MHGCYNITVRGKITYHFPCHAWCDRQWPTYMYWSTKLCKVSRGCCEESGECTFLVQIQNYSVHLIRCSHYEILTLKITLKILEWLWKSMKLPKTKEFSNPEIFQRYFSAFSVLNLLPIMSTEIHLNHPKWFSAWLHWKTSQYFFSVISSFSVWLAKCKNQYLNNKDNFQCDFQCSFSVYFFCIKTSVQFHRFSWIFSAI